MFNIYKGNLIRLVKNFLFIGGCILAFAITFTIASGRFPIDFLQAGTPEDRTFFASAAMVLYFSFFTTIFVSVEYQDGIIRNRIISGFSQIEIYVASLFAQYSAVIIMYAAYLLGGVLGGARFNLHFLKLLGIFLLSLLAYVTVTNAIAFRIKKVVFSTILTMMLFNACFNMVMFGNAILNFMENETALKIGKIIYNIHSLGQWFSMTPFSLDYTNPGYGVMIVLSCLVIIPAFSLPLIGLKKRELN